MTNIWISWLNSKDLFVIIHVAKFFRLIIPQVSIMKQKKIIFICYNRTFNDFFIVSITKVQYGIPIKCLQFTKEYNKDFSTLLSVLSVNFLINVYQIYKK